jgi:hypothetical protein
MATNNPPLHFRQAFPFLYDFRNEAVRSMHLKFCFVTSIIWNFVPYSNAIPRHMCVNKLL